MNVSLRFNILLLSLRSFYTFQRAERNSGNVFCLGRRRHRTEEKDFFLLNYFYPQQTFSRANEEQLLILLQISSHSRCDWCSFKFFHLQVHFLPLLIEFHDKRQKFLQPNFASRYNFSWFHMEIEKSCFSSSCSKLKFNENFWCTKSLLTQLTLILKANWNFLKLFTSLEQENI